MSAQPVSAVELQELDLDAVASGKVAAWGAARVAGAGVNAAGAAGSVAAGAAGAAGVRAVNAARWAAWGPPPPWWY
jgi:hypothetical protein